MSEKTSKDSVLGALPDDAVRVRQCLNELGRSQAWLAREARLSLAMLNAFVNGKKNLSPAASDRVMTAISQGFAAGKPRLTLEAAGRIRQRVEALMALDGPPRDLVSYEAWKVRQIELHAAAKELPVAKEWIKHLEKQIAELAKEVSLLRELETNTKELIPLLRGQVMRLKLQLTEAGLNPTE